MSPSRPTTSPTPRWSPGCATTASGSSSCGGFDGEFASCLDEETQLCPAISLPDLFGAGSVPSQERIRGVLELLPAYFSQAVVETRPGDRADRRHGGALVRYQGDAVRRAEAADRRDPRPDRPARERPAANRGGGTGRRPAGTDRRRQRVARVEPLPAHDRRAARGGARPPARLPLAQARARAAGPGAARARLVGAGPGGGGRSAEPDVGDAGRAGDRDRDRVQRAALGPLSRGARGRRVRRRGAAALVLAHGSPP